MTFITLRNATIYSAHPICDRTGAEWPRDDEEIRAAFAGCPRRHRGGRPHRPAGRGGRARRGRAGGWLYRDRGRTRDRGRRRGHRPDPHSGQGFRDRAFRQPRQNRAADRDLRRAGALRDGYRDPGPAPDRLRAGGTGPVRGTRRRRRRDPSRLQPGRRGAHGRGRARRRAGPGPAGPRRTRRRLRERLSATEPVVVPALPRSPAARPGSGGAEPVLPPVMLLAVPPTAGDSS